MSKDYVGHLRAGDAEVWRNAQDASTVFHISINPSARYRNQVHKYNRGLAGSELQEVVGTERFPINRTVLDKGENGFVERWQYEDRLH
jgi:hypothetical protein